jgi:hypothetical protein
MIDSSRYDHSRMTRLISLVFLSLVFFCSVAPARAQDDQYLRIYRLIQEADALQTSLTGGCVSRELGRAILGSDA